MRANPLIDSFNGGELSPLFSSRPSLEKYQAGLQLCENFIPRVQGPIERRGGTRYVATTRTAADRVWLAPFIYSVNDAFVLEFGDQYVRFYRDRGVLTDGGGAYQIATPYRLADLTDPHEGSCALSFVQSGDVIYLAHPAYPPQKLTRHANTDWTLTPFAPDGGPFNDANSDHAVTVYADAGTLGTTVNLTASAPIWTAGMVGGLFYLEQADARDIKPWAPSQLVAIGDIRSSDGKFYSAVDIFNHTQSMTGPQKPVHTSGDVWDGDGNNQDLNGSFVAAGVKWRYLHAGYGWIRITGFTDASHVAGMVLSLLPDGVVGSANASWRWATGAWSNEAGWPTTVEFFRERLTFWKGRDGYTSVAGDFETFKAKSFGLTDLSSAVRISIQSGRGDAVKWMRSVGRSLLLGTGGGEVVVREQTPNEAFGPGNTTQEPQTQWGSNGVAPVVVGSAVLYVEATGKGLREAGYDLQQDGFVSDDMTLFAGHLFESPLIALAFQRNPHSVVWAARSDGLLLGFTYMKQQGVSGWHRHPIAGGAVESVATIPSPDGGRDDVWLIVRRMIGGVAVRHVEYIAAEYQADDDRALSGYSDAHLVYDGAPTTTISGLDHLEGLTVQVMADGAAHPDRVVQGGSITLTAPAARVIAGLSAPARGRIMPIEAGAAGGTAQGRIRRVRRILARLVNTIGLSFGGQWDLLDAPNYRPGAAAMDQPTPLFTGLVQLDFAGDYDRDASISWEMDNPFPATLCALMPEMTTSEG